MTKKRLARPITHAQLHVLVDLYDTRETRGVRYDTARRLCEMGLAAPISLIDGRITITELGDRAVRECHRVVARVALLFDEQRERTDKQ